MTKKKRAKRAASRTGAAPSRRDGARDAALCATLECRPTAYLIEYAQFRLDNVPMPLYWNCPKQCQRDFDAFWERLKSAHTIAATVGIVQEYPQVVRIMQIISPDARTCAEVERSWEKARDTMLYVSREFCLAYGGA